MTSRVRGGGFLRYAMRVAHSSIVHPVETSDRIKTRLELMRFRNRHVSVDVSDLWEMEFHRLVGAQWPCDASEEFRIAWRDFESSNAIEARHDANSTLVRVLYCAVRHLKPNRMIETGVARGVSTRFALHALAENRKGHIWSIDLPPVFRGWASQVGDAVPDHLRSRWTYIRGSSQRKLRGLIEQLGALDIFIHDSLHTSPTVAFELKTAWRSLCEGGLIIADDVGLNDAFLLFVQNVRNSGWLIARRGPEGGFIGIVQK